MNSVFSKGMDELFQTNENGEITIAFQNIMLIQIKVPASYKEKKSISICWSQKDILNLPLESEVTIFLKNHNWVRSEIGFVKTCLTKTDLFTDGLLEGYKSKAYTYIDIFNKTLLLTSIRLEPNTITNQVSGMMFQIPPIYRTTVYLGEAYIIDIFTNPTNKCDLKKAVILQLICKYLLSESERDSLFLKLSLENPDYLASLEDFRNAIEEN